MLRKFGEQSAVRTLHEGQITLMAFNKGKKTEQTRATATAVVDAPVEATVPTRPVPAVNMDDELLSSSIEPLPEVAPALVAAPVAQTGPVMTFTAADVAEMVRSAVQAAVQGMTQANTGIADQIAQGFAIAHGPRQLRVSEIGEPKTPFNPEGKKRELLKEFFQNGAPIHERFVSDGEIEMLHKLVPGSYGTPELPIAVVEKKRLNGPNRLYIVHNDSKDARLMMKNYARNFHEMLVKLVQEAKEQRSVRRAEARAFLAESDDE